MFFIFIKPYKINDIGKNIIGQNIKGVNNISNLFFYFVISNEMNNS
jgi:hypothetical protein